MPDKTQILLIDDHALFREAIARMLSAQPDFEVAGEAATIDEGLEIVKIKPVDLVLLDINLGLQQGGAFLNLAPPAGFEGKVLVVTAGVSKVEAARLRQKGCAGIFLKHERPQILIENIRQIMQGEEASDREMTTAVAEQMRVIDQESRRPLTARERQVLRGVFSGLSNKEIATELGISVSLVKAFVQQLFRKAQVRSRAQLVRAAIERYWSEVEDASAGN
jgi:two-component system nitrate/nitrite response regulator NarL